MKKYIQGVYDPKNCRFLDPVGTSQPKLKRSIPSKRHVLATYLSMAERVDVLNPFLVKNELDI
jgi:hypothetical protein